jgi:hypothetical protein
MSPVPTLGCVTDMPLPSLSSFLLCGSLSDPHPSLPTAELHDKEQHLVTVRAEKQQYADKLIDVMADYEKRKTDILNGIAKLVGEDPVDAPTPAKPVVKANFPGF